MKPEGTILMCFGFLFIALGFWITPILVPIQRGGKLTYLCGEEGVNLEKDNNLDKYVRNHTDVLFRWYGISNGCFHFELQNATKCAIIIVVDDKRKYVRRIANKFCPNSFDAITAHAICQGQEDVVFWSREENDYLQDPYPLMNSSLFACPSYPRLCLYDITLGNDSLVSDECGTKIFHKTY